jgi:uncharacterized cupin superfamily protein
MTGSSAPHLYNPMAVSDLVDWGVVPTMIEGSSSTSGVVLHKGPDGRSETGIWVCTPGCWNCHVTADEFCHFLEGRCTRYDGVLSRELERHLPGSRDNP